MFIVVYNEHGESCDGHTRYLGSAESREEAVKIVNKDIDTYVSSNGRMADLTLGQDILVDRDKMEVWADEYSDIGCIWDIIDVPEGIPTSTF